MNEPISTSPNSQLPTTAMETRATGSPTGDYMARQRSAKARQILEMANKIGVGGDLDDWQNMANKLVSNTNLYSITSI